MDALHQGASAALVLLGIAAMLFGVAALWRAVGKAKARQEELLLDREMHELAAERARGRAAQAKHQRDLLFAMMPAIAGVIGHWLGTLSGRHAREDFSLPWGGCVSRTAPPQVYRTEPDDDETQVELDLGSLFDAMVEAGIGEWISNVVQRAKSTRTAAEDDDDAPAPTPTVATAANA